MARIPLYLFAMLTIACSSQQNKPTKQAEVPNFYIDEKDTSLKRSGALLLFNGKPFSGHISSYFEVGPVRSNTSYFNGKREGKSVVYYESGQLKELRFYSDNKKVGHHKGWWPNGNPKFDYVFSNGLLEGTAKEWYEKGDVYRVFNYSKGKESGSQKMWEPDGSIRANYVVKNSHRYGLIGLKNCKSVNDEKDIYTALAY